MNKEAAFDNTINAISTSGSSYYLSVKTKDGDYKHFKVPYEIYLYVNQLEFAVKHPTVSCLSDLYPERFSILKKIETFEDEPDGTTSAVMSIWADKKD